MPYIVKYNVTEKYNVLYEYLQVFIIITMGQYFKYFLKEIDKPEKYQVEHKRIERPICKIISLFSPDSK